MVLVDFWTRECINCQHTLPYVRDWANKYRAAGLVVIGVHTPEYPWERSLPLLRRAVKDWRITYPVVADNEYAIWNAFGNQYWPAHYIFDARGQLRYTAFGEGDYARRAGDPAAAAGEQSLTRGAGVWRTDPPALIPDAGRRCACPDYMSAQGECRPGKAQPPPGIDAERRRMPIVGDCRTVPFISCACCRAALRLPGLHERAGRM